MNNSSLFPFERNHYFYGKLLSVEDFELEQRYLNDKRRLINRFLFGAGVAVGLNVVDVDEQTVSVEAGFALDSWGREIVVEEPVLLRLDNITGFDSCLKENADVIYLCLEYREQETDIVHSITDATSGDHRHQEYGRIRESFRLFLTSREPEEELRNVISAKNLIECPKVIWENEDIRITHILPRLIQKGHGAFLTVRVENRGRSTVSFSYELMLSGLSHETDQKSVIRVNFDESLYEKTGDYELRFPLVAPEGSKEYGCVNINPDSVKLSLSGSEIPVKLGNEQTVLLTEKNEAEAIQDYYYQLPMEQVAESGYQAPIYLARLFVVSAVDTYMIERVENLPYKQYVSNNRLLANFGDQLAAKVKLGGSIWGQANDAGSAGGGRVQALGQIVIAQGVADLVIQGGRRDDTIFSQEITHGIGLGRVAIILGLQEHKKEIIYGDSDVFEEDSGKIRVKLAAKVNEDDGTFVIGVKLLAGTAGGRIRVHWTAIRDRHNEYEKSEKRIFIKPNLLEMTVRSSYQLESVCENMVERAVRWQVRDEGGFIDEKGLYTAPNTAGVYEVIAQSVAYPEVKASIFVVVRE